MLNTSRYRIIAIGKIKKLWISDGINTYKKRLPNLSIIEVKSSNLNKEANDITSLLKENEVLIPLCEKGEILSSIDFSNRLQELGSKRLTFIIGGADGLAPKIKSLAHFSLSLSPLTFPHEIARLLLLEQIYRASTIAHGTPYHRH